MSFGEPWFYIVLLGVAALLYGFMLPARQKRDIQVRSGQEDIEAALEQYLAEVEKENNELIDLVASMKQDFAAKQLSQQEQLAELRRRLGEVELASREHGVKLDDLEELSRASAWKPAPANFELPAAMSAVQAESAAASAQAEVIQPDLPEVVISSADDEAASPTMTVRERYPELFDLYEKGKSVDAIAKATGIQRGEVQLILQLAKREGIR